MDEPFSALDVQRHSDMQEKTLGIIEAAALTTLVVTHDIDDALMLADSVFVLNGGRIMDTVRIELQRPRTSTTLNSRVAKNYAEQLKAWLRY